MAVRVGVKIKSSESGKPTSTVAVANAGFETDSLEIILPLSLAKELGSKFIREPLNAFVFVVKTSNKTNYLISP